MTNKSVNTDKDLITIAEAAKILKVHPKTVYELRKVGAITSYQFLTGHRHYKVRRSDIEEIKRKGIITNHE